MRKLTKAQQQRYIAFRDTLPLHIQTEAFVYFNIVRFDVPMALFLVEEDKLKKCELDPDDVVRLARPYGLHETAKGKVRLIGDIDEAWALAHADLSVPILLARFSFHKEMMGSIIDGHHRLFRACIEQTNLYYYQFGEKQIDLISPSLRELEQIAARR
jgi:hypothetical protein